jgi:hypothetical protein
MVGEEEVQEEFEGLGFLPGEEYSWTTAYVLESEYEQQDPFHRKVSPQ